MFATLRLGLVARLLRAPISLASQRVGPLSTPTVLARRTFLTSVRVNEPAAAKATEKKSEKKTRKPVAQRAAKPVRKTAAAKKKTQPKKKTVAKKRVTRKVKPKKAKAKAAPKVDKKLLKPPKRPAAPFVAYYAEHYDGKSKSIPELTAASRESAAKWNALSDNVKEEYRQRQQERLKAWRKEYEQWYNGLSKVQMRQAKKLNKNKRLRQPEDLPKRPASAYILFYQEFLTQQSGGGSISFNVEVSKEAGRAWKALSESNKDVYKQRYVGALEQYRKDLEVYKRQFSPNA